MTMHIFFPTWTLAQVELCEQTATAQGEASFFFFGILRKRNGVKGEVVFSQSNCLVLACLPSSHQPFFGHQDWREGIERADKGRNILSWHRQALIPIINTTGNFSSHAIRDLSVLGKRQGDHSASQHGYIVVAPGQCRSCLPGLASWSQPNFNLISVLTLIWAQNLCALGLGWKMGCEEIASVENAVRIKIPLIRRGIKIKRRGKSHLIPWSRWAHIP